MYWVSCIIQDSENSAPWLCAASTGELRLDSAMDIAAGYAENYRCLSVWIDESDENNDMKTVWHECLLLPDGSVRRHLATRAGKDRK